jgi:hypothetical protein
MRRAEITIARPPVAAVTPALASACRIRGGRISEQ